MMRSFAKKLAFVMAAAMVVTTAAPAARASAATELSIVKQTATSKAEALTVVNVGEGATVDLKFYGAPTNFKELNPTWTSSNEKVATVDKNGNVTGVAEGVAEITFTLSDGSEGSVKAIVGNDYSATPLGIALQSATSKDEVKSEITIGVDETVDFKFYGAPKYYKNLTPTWASSDPEVATVDKNGNVTGVKDGTATIIFKLDNGQYGTLAVTVGKGEVVEEEVKVEEMTPAQKTAYSVEVKFTNEHKFDATGTDEDGKNTVKIYRVFSTEEMSKMANKNGLKFDEEGNGYQAFYVQNTDAAWLDEETRDYTTWTITGYDAFVDGGKYAVVYGENETSSTIKGIVEFFTAYVGKVAYIELSATDATVENDVEPAVPAYISARLFNIQGIDLTSYYKDADETDYELIDENVEASLAGNEVTFDEPGYAHIQGTYTFYDEEKEEDVALTAKVVVKGDNYSKYRIDSIYNWTLKSGYGNDGWATTSTSMIAGDNDELYVIVKDNRGNYYSNVEGIEDWNNGNGYWINGKKVLEVGNGDDNTPFEQYGYELVFDSLDPDSLLVDKDGFVTSYKKTNSFAVVYYRYAGDDSAALHEIGVMGIEVTPARKINSLNYVHGSSFIVLKETEAEDGEANYYAGYDDFNLEDDLTIEILNQYGKLWDGLAEDYNEVVPEFTVTTSKDDFDGIAEEIATALNSDTGSVRNYRITSAIFEGKNTTSVTFKIKENATGDSRNVTIKLDKPQYVKDANGNETDEVYVDPNRAILDIADQELYLGTTTAAKLFQVSKATQKVGYVRTGALEINLSGDAEGDEDRCYYLAEDVAKNFYTNADRTVADFITTATNSALFESATRGALKEGDYVLVVTDPNGKVVPSQGKGGNGLAINDKSNLGIVASDDNTRFDLKLVALNDDGVLEYAAAGTYRANVYKITNIVTANGTTKYNTSRVSSDSFTVSKTLKDVSFYHQETTKDVENIGSFATKKDIMEAIAQTMTFRISGQNFMVSDVVDGVKTGKYTAGYMSYLDFWADGYWGSHWLGIELYDVDYKIQEGGDRAVINTVTFKVSTPAGEYYLSKVKVNRSVNVAD